jgi:hypothetical protein
MMMIVVVDLFCVGYQHIIGTESSSFPKVDVHPLGIAVGYPGVSAARIDSLSGELLYQRPRNMDNCAHKFVAISPNGQLMAALTRGSTHSYLEFFGLQFSLISHQVVNNSNLG